MQTLIKKNSGILFGALVLFAMLVLFVCLPQTAHAAIDSTVTPYIYCTYTDSNGDPADGNNLQANEQYQVTFMLEGVSSISVLEVTASIAEETDAQTGEPVALATVGSTPVANSLLSDTHNDITSMGYVLSNGNIVFGFVSDNANSSTVSAEGVQLATISVTFAEDCDAEDVIIISTNPNMTFVQTDYSDGYQDAYALVDTFEDYTGTLYPMTADVSPAQSCSVSGTVVMVTNTNGTSDGRPAYGTYYFDIYADSQRSDLLQTVATTAPVAENDYTNSFVIDGLSSGTTYYATLRSSYSLTRADITINISSADISGAVIPVIALDFNGDTTVNAADTGAIYQMFASGNYDASMDLNNDNVVNAADTGMVYTFFASQPQLSPIVIE